jgi:hypothetical protein
MQLTNRWVTLRSLAKVNPVKHDLAGTDWRISRHNARSASGRGAASQPRAWPEEQVQAARVGRAPVSPIRGRRY